MIKNKILIISFLLLSIFTFSQKLYVGNISDKSLNNIENLTSHIAKELSIKYKNENKRTYFINSFRINLINKNYVLSKSQLDSAISITKKQNPVSAETMDITFGSYIQATNEGKSQEQFEKKFNEIFTTKYQNASFQAKNILLYNYDTTKEELINVINKTLNSNEFKGDSVDIKIALSLVLNYNSLQIFDKTSKLALTLIDKFEKEDYTIKENIILPLSNNESMSLTYVLNNKLVNPQNTILVNTIYTNDNIYYAKRMANYGYNCVILYVKGKQGGKGFIEPFRNEINHINIAIDWVIKQPWSNGKVGMFGGSYLGFSQWAATKNLHPALKTIVPQAPVGIGYMDFPMNNHIFQTHTYRWLNNVTIDNKEGGKIDGDKLKSFSKKWYESGKSFKKLDSIHGKTNKIFQEWLSHPSHDYFWQKMIPYNKEFSKIDIPILTITGYYDDDQLGAMFYFNQHYKYHKKPNHYLIIGPYDHSIADGYFMNKIRNYEIDTSAKINLEKICIDWFDYILKGKEKPEFLKDKINYQVMGDNIWKSTSSLENIDKTRKKVYLSKNNDSPYLVKSKPSESKYNFLKVDFKDRSDADEILAFENNILDKTTYTKNQLLFTSDPFDKSAEITGNFTGKLQLEINKKDVDLWIRLYEKLPDGNYFLLSSFLGRASYSKNPEKRNLLTPHEKEIFTFDNTEFVSKKINKGSQLILMVGVNKTPYYQINYGTGKDVSDEDINDAGEPLELKLYNDSYIEIPISE